MFKNLYLKLSFVGLCLFALGACSDDDDEAGLVGAPECSLNSDTGEYKVKIGHEVTLQVTAENAINPVYAWKRAGKIVSEQETYQFKGDQLGEFFVNFRLDADNGSVEKQAKITVVDRLPPEITVSSSAVGYCDVALKVAAETKRYKPIGLFTFMDEGPGFPFFLPNGMVLKNQLIDYWREIHKKAGYVEISTPIMLNQDLWHRSGHWDHYKDNMYTTVIDDVPFALKPMNCPGGMLVYKSQPHSYRDLPLRVGELGIVHRHELSGALHGLFRVRCFTQDDAHIFMTPDQVKDEIKGVAKLIDDVYSLFGFKYHMELSTMPEDHIGTDEQWEVATNGLVSALNELGKPYVINEGDGAFYGPKIDFHLEDSLGRTWQCGTIQLDMQMPERFDLEYVGADGEKHRPVMIHRVCFGSIERFIGILTEHYAGAFPLWLAPVQVKVMPITDRTNNYAKHVADRLEKAGLRVETDLRNEKIGYKIREAQSQKIPYMLVLGDKEAENDTISVRTLAGEQSVESLSDFIARLQADVKSRKS